MCLLACTLPERAALLHTPLQGVLLPLLAGAAVKTALPSQVAAVAPLLQIAALALVSLVCGSVVAGSMEAARVAGLRLVGAVAAAQAGGLIGAEGQESGCSRSRVRESCTLPAAEAVDVGSHPGACCRHHGAAVCRQPGRPAGSGRPHCGEDGMGCK